MSVTKHLDRVPRLADLERARDLLLSHEDKSQSWNICMTGHQYVAFRKETPVIPPWLNIEVVDVNQPK